MLRMQAGSRPFSGPSRVGGGMPIVVASRSGPFSRVVFQTSQLINARKWTVRLQVSSLLEQWCLLSCELELNNRTNSFLRGAMTFTVP